MRLLMNWLAEFTEVPEDPRDLADRLTDIGLEVDEILRLDRAIDRVVTARVMEAEYHPDRRDWLICDIEADGTEARVVTAAPGVRPGQVYLWAEPGARLPEIEVKTETFRGVESEGMMCSSRELGLTDESQTLLQVPDDTPTGQPAVDVLGLREPILELDLTPNRSDCLSHLGAARDLAAAESRSLRDPRPESLPDGAASEWSIEIDAPDDCRAYIGVPVSGVQVGPSPFDVQKRILKMGYRPLNNLVDYTNHTLFEVGHPLHPFDADQLTPPIHVRRAREDEQLETLDGETRDLSEQDLVIADDERAQALAGIMGGSDTQVSERTTNLLLEGAYFDPIRVRRSADRHRMSTEASHRFERGTDDRNIDRCLARCVQMIQEDPLQSEDLVVHEPARQRTSTRELTRIPFDPDSFEPYIGYDLTPQDQRQRLERLGISVDVENGRWICRPPSWRHDLHRSEDLIEEIVRLDGYRNIPMTFPSLPLDETPRPGDRERDSLRHQLIAAGFHEAITFSFLDPGDHHFTSDDSVHRLSNPLARTQSTMRKTVLSGLLGALRRNLESGERDVRLFEVAHVFPGEGTEEPRHLGLLATGDLYRHSWDEHHRRFDFYDLKGLLHVLLESNFGLTPEVREGPSPGFHPNRCGMLVVEGHEVGRLGEVHPDVVDVKGQPSVWGAELNLTALPSPRHTRFSPYSTQPVVKRDLDLVVDREQTVGPIRECIEETAQWLESTRIFDVYRGDPLPRDKKSVSFTLTFQSEDRTLQDEEVNEVQDQILTALNQQFGAVLRDE